MVRNEDFATIPSLCIFARGAKGGLGALGAPGGAARSSRRFRRAQAAGGAGSALQVELGALRRAAAEGRRGFGALGWGTRFRGLGASGLST